MPNRTPLHLEKLVVELAKETNLGPQRLAGMLQRSFAISLSPSTIRNILRRYGLRCQKYRTVNGNRRYKADLDKYRPFEFWQIDAKYVADKTALPPEAYAAIFRNNLPKYQFTAIDVKTRLRFIAYAHNLSFSNGLAARYFHSMCHVAIGAMPVVILDHHPYRSRAVCSGGRLFLPL
jgi:putative transposase